MIYPPIWGTARVWNNIITARVHFTNTIEQHTLVNTTYVSSTLLLLAKGRQYEMCHNKTTNIASMWIWNLLIMQFIIVTLWYMLIYYVSNESWSPQKFWIVRSTGIPTYVYNLLSFCAIYRKIFLIIGNNILPFLGQNLLFLSTHWQICSSSNFKII